MLRELRVWEIFYGEEEFGSANLLSIEITQFLLFMTHKPCKIYDPYSFIPLMMEM